MLMLIAYVGHAYWLFSLRCGRVDMAHMGSTSKLLVCGDPAVGYMVATVAIEVRAFWCRLYADYQIASFTTNSMENSPWRWRMMGLSLP